MKTPHGFIGLAAAIVLASGCNYVIGIEDKTYDRERPKGTGGSGGTGGTGGGSSAGGSDAGGGGSAPCQVLAYDAWSGGDCAGGPCDIADDFSNVADSISTWDGRFIAEASTAHMQICEADEYLLIRPQAGNGGSTGEGLAWSGSERAGALYIEVADNLFVAAAEVEPLNASTNYQGAGLSIHSDDGHWMLLSLTTIAQGPPAEGGVQLFYYRNDSIGDPWPDTVFPADTSQNVVMVNPSGRVDAPVNAPRFVGVCRAADGWHLYQGTTLASMQLIDGFEGFDYLDGDRSVRVGPTAHNYQNQSPFEARVHQAHVVVDGTLGSSSSCRTAFGMIGSKP